MWCVAPISEDSSTEFVVSHTVSIHVNNIAEVDIFQTLVFSDPGCWGTSDLIPCLSKLVETSGSSRLYTVEAQLGEFQALLC